MSKWNANSDGVKSADFYIAQSHRSLRSKRVWEGERRRAEFQQAVLPVLRRRMLAQPPQDFSLTRLSRTDVETLCSEPLADPALLTGTVVSDILDLRRDLVKSVPPSGRVGRIIRETYGVLFECLPVFAERGMSMSGHTQLFRVLRDAAVSDHEALAANYLDVFEVTGIQALAEAWLEGALQNRG